MLDSILDCLDPKSEKLVFLMYFLPIFTTAYMYYQNASSFYLWLLIISTILIVIMESYHFAYMSAITSKDVVLMNKKMRSSKNVIKTVNEIKPLGKWYFVITGIWIILYIYVVVRLFMFEDTTTTLMGIFQAALILFITLKALFTIYFIIGPGKTKEKNKI